MLTFHFNILLINSIFSEVKYYIMNIGFELVTNAFSSQLY